MNKKTNKLVCVLLVILLCITMPFSVMASTGSGVAQAQLLQEGSFEIPEEQVSIVSFYGAGNTDTLQEIIYDALINCEEKISISTSSYRFLPDEIKDIYSNVINDNPELFYVSSTFGYSYSKITGYVVSITPYYSMNADEIENNKAIFEAGVQEALSVVDDSMNDVQKALVIHDYICDKANYYAGDEITHSAFGFFYDGNVVCAGYTLAYSYLMEKLGIQSEYMASTSMQHAWNVIKIDGKWYHVDLTYDDVYNYNENENMRGAMYHRCFMKSDEAMMGDMGFYHYGFSTFDGGVATDTSYDDYFWNDVNTTIPVIDGDYYYPDYNSTTRYIYMMKRNVDGTESKLSTKSFNTAVFNLTGSYPDENGTYHSVSFSDPLIRIAQLDGKIYIAYNKYIYSVFTNGKYYKVCDISNYPVGLGVENGSLVYQPYSTFTPVTIDKAEFLNTYLMTSPSDTYNNYPDVNNDGNINTVDFALSKDIL